VLGDLIRVSAGERIPADLVLIEANEMKVNNTIITGEDCSLLRDPESEFRNIFESQRVCFAQTTCTGGTGVGLVS
jgi:sodium/potassium-transporting ATPase subunit alpha